MSTPRDEESVTSSDDARRGLVRKTSQAVLWNVILVPLLGLLSVVTSALIARVLSTSDYRLYVLAVATITSLLLWSDLGMTPMVSRFTPELKERGSSRLRRFLRRVAVVRLIALAATVVAILVARRLGASEELLPFDGLELAVVVSVALLQGLGRISQYFLTGLLERKAVGTIHLLAGLAQALLVIAAALAGLGVIGILTAMALAAALELVLSRRRAARELPPRLQETPAGAERGEASEGRLPARARRFAAVSFVEKVASYVNSSAFVIFLVAAFGDHQDVVLFAVAGEFAARMVSLLSIPLSGVTLPLFSNIDARAGARESTVALRLYLMLLLLLYLPTGALLTTLSPWIVPLLYSDRYLAAVPIAMVLIPFLFLEHCLQPAVSAVLLTQGKFRLVLASRIPALATIPLVILALPHHGAIGAAVVLGLSRLACAGLLMFLGWFELRFRYPLLFAAKVTLASGLAVWLVRFWGALPNVGLGWDALIPLALVGAVTFFTTYKLLGGIGTEGRSQVAKALPGLSGLLRYVL